MMTNEDKVAVTQTVADGLEAVRQDGRCNMVDLMCVLQALVAFGCDDAAEWVAGNRDAYGRLIFHGLTVIDEED